MDERDQNASGERFRLLINVDFRRRAPYPEEARAVIGAVASERARRHIRDWPGYSVTPLVELADTARRCGVARVAIKDEGTRFGLGSFKVVGAAYGALRALQRELWERSGEPVDVADVRSGAYREDARAITLACATDGNHGRALAWAAGVFGCSCEVYVPHIVSGRRRREIEAHGARVTRVDGTYDDALRALAAAASRNGWLVVSDQAYADYEDVPRDIMQGYTLVAEEALDQWHGDDGPTHVFVQAGVGGFAAAVCGHLWERLGAARPRFVCVEPLAADCLYRSAATGHPVRVPGDLDTLMACLSCGEPSSLAWRVLAAGATAFIAVDDRMAIDAMRALATGRGRRAVVAGESGAAGLAGLMALCGDKQARERLRLDDRARVLLFATEGATDPEVYESLVGASPEEVAAGGRTSG